MPNDKIMFEIYKEEGESAGYHVIYFTELDEDERDAEIDRAMAGDHLLGGFLAERHATQAKSIIADAIGRLNHGEPFEDLPLRSMLQPYLVE